MLPFFDIIKRRIMFWKYTKIVVDLPEEMIIQIKNTAKADKMSLEAKCEQILKNYLK